MVTDERQDAPARPPRQRRPGGRSARVREAAIAATLAELADHGYAALSLENVARRSGVHKTTLYRRWGTREDLVLEAMLDRADLNITVPDTGSLRDDLSELARTAAANAATPEVAAMARAVVAQADHDPTLDAARRRFWTARLALDGTIVERAIQRGDVPPETDPHTVIESIIGPIHLRLLLTGEPVDQAFLDAVVDTVLGGVTTTTAQPARSRNHSR